MEPSAAGESHTTDASLDESLDAACAIEEFLGAFRGHWPPRPSFDWPDTWLKYRDICDEMPKVVSDLNNPEKFRAWMKESLDSTVNLGEVMAVVEDHLELGDPVLTGFQGCLQYLINIYRWGSIPVQEEEVKRDQLDFPEQLWQPYIKIADLHGIVHRPNFFNIAYACTMYDSDDKPKGQRFWWNYDPDIRRSESNFMLCITDVEGTFEPALHIMRDYLLETESSRKSSEEAKNRLAKRTKLLEELQRNFVDVGKTFQSYTKESVVRKDIFGSHIQNIVAWGLGGLGGASGSETLVLASLDEFLGITGESPAYLGALMKRENMPYPARTLLDALRQDKRDTRFDTLTEGPDENPLVPVKDELVKSIYIWRLGHARTSTNYMANSTMTSSKIIEPTMGKDDTLAGHGLLLGQKRARETANHMVSRGFDVLPMDASAGY